MALSVIPSSFECDCGHQSHFCENVVREIEELTRRARKPQILIDSEPDEHRIEFHRGKATAVICPRLGRCEIIGWK